MNQELSDHPTRSHVAFWKRKKLALGLLILILIFILLWALNSIWNPFLPIIKLRLVGISQLYAGKIYQKGNPEGTLRPKCNDPEWDDMGRLATDIECIYNMPGLEIKTVKPKYRQGQSQREIGTPESVIIDSFGKFPRATYVLPETGPYDNRLYKDGHVFLEARVTTYEQRYRSVIYHYSLADGRFEMIEYPKYFEPSSELFYNNGYLVEAGTSHAWWTLSGSRMFVYNVNSRKYTLAKFDHISVCSYPHIFLSDDNILYKESNSDMCPGWTYKGTVDFSKLPYNNNAKIVILEPEIH